MKRLIIFLLLFAAIKVAGQTTGYLRFDTVKIMKQNGTCELYIQNKTKDSTGGILTNIGNGLTSFVPTRQVVDTIFVGGDTVIISHKLDSIHVYSGSSPNPDTIYQYKGGDSTIAGYIPKPANNNTNVGSAFRWLIPNTQQIKTVADSWGIKWDSTSTANALTAKPDTGATGLATQYDLTQVGGNQNIQNVLTVGDSAQRRIYYKDVNDTSLAYTLFTQTIVPRTYNTVYLAGTQGRIHQGFGFYPGVNPLSGRPNMVYSPFSYNSNPGSATRDNTNEAVMAQMYELNFDIGGQPQFESYLQIVQRDGFAYRPDFWVISKNSRGATFSKTYATMQELYLSATGATDTVLRSSGPTGQTFGFTGNGGINGVNRRNTANGFGLNMTDNGLSITSTSSGANSINLGSATTITNTNNAPALSINPATGFNQPGIRITGGTAGAGKSLIQADITAAGIVPVTFANNNTTAANYISFQVQHAGGRPEMVWWQNSNNYYIFRLRGNSADDSTLRLHYVGNDVLYFKKNGSMGIGITPGAFKLNVEGSVRINKDSVSLQAANDTRHMLVIDTATGRLQRMAIPSGGGGITSINSETGPAISIAAGTGISVNNTTNTVTVSTNTSYLTSGTYTPTLTNTSNVAASVASVSQYMRIGNVIHVSGMVQIDATAAATVTELGISLPVSSDFVEEFECAGTTTATYSGANESGNIRADVTNNRALIRFYSTSTDNQAWFFTFTYLVAGGS